MALIRLENVSKSFGDRIALSDVTLSFDPGEWVFVLGPSGAGKSTLLRLLALAEKPSQGRVEVDPDAISSPKTAPSPVPEAPEAPVGDGDGESPEAPARRRSPKRVPLRRVRRLVGVLGQEFRLLGDRSVYENIALACQISGIWDRSRIRERITPLLDEMGIRGKETLFPEDLSAGEKQRVALARAMARHPRILIADEPTGNLDPAAAGQIFALLREIGRRGTLVAVATHAEDWVRRHPGRAIRLERGMLRSDQPEGEP
ncbi:MAG: ATP-binding cassette domain-containing protein [Candidatus Eisenbacteria bacterium]|uniref:ATP-binding cassette domain-containing protein n=1 Tax=Eiseniibacteriota bacterium TaxID=2212470 RepID=A0A538TGI4_UNCEI|nr:MAG: ATP-binding cassette domain-containing protein [Candidatus Eisenbacteria bacterium]